MHPAPTKAIRKNIIPRDLLVRDLSKPNFITIPMKLTAEDAIHQIRKSEKHGIFYLYTVDDENRVKGVVSVRALLLANENQKISDIHALGVVTLTEETPVEEAYQTFSLSRFLSLPVVNEQGNITGVLNAHELIEEYEKDLEELFQERSRGELFELLGIQGSDPVKSPFAVAKRRLPWLLINLLGGAISAFFIHDLARGIPDAVLYLAFVPVLLIITESMGMQTMSIVIGHLNQKNPSPMRDLFVRETTIAFFLALSCAAIISVPVLLWKANVALSLTIAITIIIGFLSACTLGHIFPAFFHRLKIDPQIAAGPVVLAIADASTLILYLIVAILLGRALG